MAVFKKRIDFLESEEGIEVKKLLLSMIKDSKYNTEPTYSTNVAEYPDNLIPFVDKHMNCLNTHPKLDADQYIANLKLMTKVR